MQGSPVIAHSPSFPSFNSYSSEKIADIAARVVQELANDSLHDDDDDSDLPNVFSWTAAREGCPERRSRSLNVEDNNKDQNDAEEEEEKEKEEDEGENDDDDDDDDDDFEFAVVWRETDSSPISADEIFFNGQIRPVYPLFNTDLLSNEERELSIPHLTASKQTTTTAAAATATERSIRSSLGKLFDEDRGETPTTTTTTTTTSSCSSSEADELDGVSPSTYCVWAPRKAAEDKDQKCKKSYSTGSSKRWKLRDLVFRSNSDGKETFVFLATPGKKSARLLGGYRGTENNNKKGQEGKGGDKRRSFLSYRPDLAGLFTNNVTGLNKNLQPF